MKTRDPSAPLREASPGERVMLVGVKREKGRALLTLSTGETLAMPRAMLKERPYRGGVPFDRASFDAFLQNRSYPFAMERAASLLAVRARSKKELRDALSLCAYPENTVARVLDALEEARYLSDEDFASQWAASRQAKGLGARRIRQELRRKGIDDDAFAEASDILNEESQLQAALVCARKAARGKDLNDPNDQRKLLASLARHGFDFSLAKQALASLLSEEE